MGARGSAGPLIGLFVLLAAVLLTPAAPAAATTSAAFAAPSIQADPLAKAPALSCERAEAKLKTAKKQLERAKKQLKAAKRKARKAKRGGSKKQAKKANAKLKKAKKKAKKAKQKVKRAKKALEGCTPTGGNAQAVANAVLARSPQRPADINLFIGEWENGSQGLYPQGKPMTPASGPVLSETQARDRLASYLRGRFGASSPQVDSGLALFDSQAAGDLVAEPALRAALVGLKGTLFEPAIAYFLESGEFIDAHFGSLPNISMLAARAGGNGSGVIIFNNAYDDEDFRYWIPTFGHEILHADSSDSPAEETINHALTGMAYGQLLKRDPGLADTGSELARVNNTDAVLFLNSREKASPDSEIYAPTGTGVAPGSPFNATDLWTIQGGAGSSPAQPLFGQILKGLGLPAATQFNQATAETFESLNDSWLSDVERVQIAVLLKEISLADISAASDLGQQQAIDLLGLQPYLDAAD